MAGKNGNSPIIPEVETNPGILAQNYPNVLKLIDNSMELIVEAMKQQLLTIRGEKKKKVEIKDLVALSRALVAVKMVYDASLVKHLPAPSLGDGPRPGQSYEDWLRQQQ